MSLPVDDRKRSISIETLERIRIRIYILLKSQLVVHSNYIMGHTIHYK